MPGGLAAARSHRSFAPTRACTTAAPLSKMKGGVVDGVRTDDLDIGFQNREAGQANRPFDVLFMHSWSFSRVLPSTKAPKASPAGRRRRLGPRRRADRLGIPEQPEAPSLPAGVPPEYLKSGCRCRRVPLKRPPPRYRPPKETFLARATGYRPVNTGCSFARKALTAV